MVEDSVRVEVSIGGQIYSLTVRNDMAPMMREAAEAVDRSVREKMRNPLLSNPERALAVVALEFAMSGMRNANYARMQEEITDSVHDLNQLLGEALAKA